MARINSVLRRPARTNQPTIEIGALTMDTATRSVRVGEVEVPLTLKEYSLLECFMCRPNEVISREELFNQVWDFNALSWSNVLDVHMKNLRKKLEQGNRPVQFETVRGVGYRLSA